MQIPQGHTWKYLINIVAGKICSINEKEIKKSREMFWMVQVEENNGDEKGEVDVVL